MGQGMIKPRPPWRRVESSVADGPDVRATLNDRLSYVVDKSRWIRHHVRPRESLSQIAYRYGVTVSQLRRWNPKELPGDSVKLKPKQKLRVWTDRTLPPRTQIHHTVGPDDTWWRIAVAHGVDSRDLRAYNWRRGMKLVPGEQVKVWIDPMVYAWVKQGPDHWDCDQGESALALRTKDAWLTRYKSHPATTTSVDGQARPMAQPTRCSNCWRRCSVFANRGSTRAPLSLWA